LWSRTPGEKRRSFGSGSSPISNDRHSLRHSSQRVSSEHFFLLIDIPHVEPGTRTFFSSPLHPQPSGCPTHQLSPDAIVASQPPGVPYLTTSHSTSLVVPNIDRASQSGHLGPKDAFCRCLAVQSTLTLGADASAPVASGPNGPGNCSRRYERVGVVVSTFVLRIEYASVDLHVLH
jgi:hypothetical protein